MSTKFQRTNAAVSIVAALFLWAASASAQTVEWQTDEGEAAGTGCNNDNTVFLQVGGTVHPGGITVVGGQLEIMFSDMTINLPAGPGTELKNCLAAVPVAIDPEGMTSIGFVLQQELEWGWVKAGATDSEGKVSLRSVFCDRKMPGLVRTTPPKVGSGNDLFVSAPVGVSLGPVPSECLYRANMVVSARTDASPISVGIFGETVNLYVLFVDGL